MNVVDGFLNSAQRFPSRPALVVDAKTYAYRELATLASGIAAGIAEERIPPHPFVGVLALRSLSAYAGVLGALLAGRTYVPLHPAFPLQRTQTMCRLSKVRTLVVGREGLGLLRELLSAASESFHVILPELRELPAWAGSLATHSFRTANHLATVAPGSLSPADFAYLLFTSGSTGEPKGVPVSHRNVRSYVEYVCDRYEVTEDDRFSQTFDLTFDLSVHDMFVCWERGACLYCIPSRALMAPARLIRDQGLTMWFSVPSLAGRMLDLRMLRPDIFPTLRVSLFCGEPLPARLAVAWQRAAPNSIVENLYGPTETTIAITRYRWDPATSERHCTNGIVPIGRPFADQRTCLIDSEGKPASPRSAGELCLSGSQVTRGYLNDAEKTRSHFVTLSGDPSLTWYRTGDLVREDEEGCLHYLGRIDDQVKIRGFRVELQEIEHELREATGGATVVAVPWPVHHGSADGVVGFIRTRHRIDAARVLARCRERLPSYMVPGSLRFLSELPLNRNGKIDRKALLRHLESE